MNNKTTVEEQKEYCTVLTSLYMKKHHISSEDMHILFPNSFMTLDDYDLKIRILVEALNNNILIEETNLFGQLPGGVRRN